jgi:mannosylglycerate hydrolase
MEELLEILDSQPEFHSFLMDSQVMCVDDYLEMRPEERPRIEKHVRSGRLQIGPWYSLPEEYIVNGESLVRNLVIGHRASAALGGTMKLGYTPFSYGQTSQMPQIYRGFDIDTIIFYRGINTRHSEFIMEGPDGSRVVGTRFGCLSRFSYYFYVYRMLRHNMTRDEWWYDWDRGALPFKLCNEAYPRAHWYILDPSKKLMQWEKLPPQLEKLIRDESEHFSTRYIACMQGFDSSSPDPLERKIIEESQRVLGDRHTIIQSSLGDYMSKMKEAIAGREVEVIKGESRDPGATGKWTHLMGDVISSRPRIKTANGLSENELQRWAEPFQTVAFGLGNRYPVGPLDMAWKYMMKNHPHDTICGAGVDQMEKDMMFRFDQVRILSQGLMRRGFESIQRRIDTGKLDIRDAVLTVFNPSPFPRSEVLTIFLDLPYESFYEAFSIVDQDGSEAPFQTVASFPYGNLVRNLQDISLELRSERFKVHFLAEDVPPLGYKTYHIRHEEAARGTMDTLVPRPNEMENEHIAVRINGNGTLDITHKATGHTFRGLHYLEDGGEVGHSWIHMSPAFDEVINSLGTPAEIALEESGPLLARYRVEYRMLIPEGILVQEHGIAPRWASPVPTPPVPPDPERPTMRRSETRREMVVRSWFTLRRGQRYVHVHTEVDNQCRNHRLRVAFPARIRSTHSHAEAAFDVVPREIDRSPGNAYYNRENPQYPNHRFVDLTDGDVGLALINEGIREYEAKDDKDRTLYLTLLRGYVFRNSPIIDRWDVYPEMELSQSLGRNEWNYAILPHEGDWEAGEVLSQADIFNLTMQAGEAGVHEGDLPWEASFVSVEPHQLALSALKKCEDRDSIILRVYNPTDKELDSVITSFWDIREAWLVNMNEERREKLTASGRSIRLTVPKKKIVTLELEVEPSA